MSRNIYGLHVDTAGSAGALAGFVRDSGREAWAVYTEAVGHDPRDTGGKDYTLARVTPIVRLNNGYGSGGTIPIPGYYRDFSERCANFVRASRGCKRWIIGNEICMSWDWPDGVMPSFSDYINCYNQCYDAIKSVQPDALVAPQAPGTWNDSIKYPGNERGDWVQQVGDQVKAIGVGRVGFIALHAYAKGYDPSALIATNRMNPPFQDRIFNFGVLWEQMGAIPNEFRHLELHLTEANGDGPWPDHNSGWVRALYREINQHNLSTGQKILSASLFRWAVHDDRWDISKHGGSVDDFRQAMQADFQHNYTGKSTSSPNTPIPPQLQPTPPGYVRINADSGLNLRKSPGGDVIRTLSNGTTIKKLAAVGDWLLVEASDGVRGYVKAEYTL